MLGVFGGDIIGSVYEFKRRTPYNFEPLFHQDANITDDSVCSVAIMDALLHDKPPPETLRTWCREYFHIGGWGKRFAFWLVSKSPAPYHSAGNGSAMRIASVAWVAKSEEELFKLCDTFTSITHNHPDGLVAARATSLAVWLARQGEKPDTIRRRLSAFYSLDFDLTELQQHYQRTERAKDSVPQAIFCALTATSYEDAVRRAVSLGGDADTQAAIAGGIAEALFGIDDATIAKITSYLDPKMRSVIHDFYDEYVMLN